MVTQFFSFHENCSENSLKFPAVLVNDINIHLVASEASRNDNCSDENVIKLVQSLFMRMDGTECE